MPNKQVLITGCTGFLGAALAVDYLKRGYKVFALCRGDDHRRLYYSLTLMDPKKNFRRGELEILRGELGQKHLGFDEETLSKMRGQLECVVNSAAYVKFGSRDPKKFEINSQGPVNVAELCKELQCDRLVHISTYAVNGKMSGDIPEELFEHKEFNNFYEQYKCEGENRVMKIYGDKTTIIRASIIVQPFSEKWQNAILPNWNGAYGFLQCLAKLKESFGVGLNEKLNLNGLELPLNLVGNLNFIPVDNMVDIIVNSSNSDAMKGKIIHGVNPTDTPYQDFLENCLADLEISNYRLKEFDPEFMTDSNPVHAGIMRFLPIFQPYICKDKNFKVNNLSATYDLDNIPSIGSKKMHEMNATALQHEFGNNIPSDARELRCFRRASVDWMGSAALGSDEFSLAKIRDISATGARMELASSHEKGQEFRFKFQLTGFGEVETMAKICWIIPSDVGVGEVGVRFSQISESSQLALEKFVNMELNSHMTAA